MPRIGCGLAGGKWEEIEPIIIRQLCEKDIAVYVYDRGYWDFAFRIDWIDFLYFRKTAIFQVLAGTESEGRLLIV